RFTNRGGARHERERAGGARSLADNGGTPLGDSVWAHAYLRGNVFACGLYRAAGSGATRLRRADARKHVQPFARGCAVSHLRLIDRYFVRGHLQFDATDDDAPAVHYLVADTHVGGFCAGGSFTGLGAPAGSLQPPGSLGRDHSRRHVEGSGPRDTVATLPVAARPGRRPVHFERVALPKAGALNPR